MRNKTREAVARDISARSSHSFAFSGALTLVQAVIDSHPAPDSILSRAPARLDDPFVIPVAGDYISTPFSCPSGTRFRMPTAVRSSETARAA